MAYMGEIMRKHIWTVCLIAGLLLASCGKTEPEVNEIGSIEPSDYSAPIDAAGENSEEESDPEEDSIYLVSVRCNASDGTWNETKYDKKGNEIYYEESDGTWIKTTYDNDRMILREKSDGIVTTYEYSKYHDQDDIVDFTQSTDGSWYRQQMNAKEQILYYLDFNGSRWDFLYDVSGATSVFLYGDRLGSVDDAGGHTIFSSIISDFYTDTLVNIYGHAICEKGRYTYDTFEYDENGELTRIMLRSLGDSAGMREFKYNPDGIIMEEINYSDEELTERKVYDPRNGNILEQDLRNEDGELVTTRYSYEYSFSDGTKTDSIDKAWVYHSPLGGSVNYNMPDSEKEAEQNKSVESSLMDYYRDYLQLDYYMPFLADLDGDGSVELIVSRHSKYNFYGFDYEYYYRGNGEFRIFRQEGTKVAEVTKQSYGRHVFLNWVDGKDTIFAIDHLGDIYRYDYEKDEMQPMDRDEYDSYVVGAIDLFESSWTAGGQFYFGMVGTDGTASGYQSGYSKATAYVGDLDVMQFGKDVHDLMKFAGENHKVIVNAGWIHGAEGGTTCFAMVDADAYNDEASFGEETGDWYEYKFPYRYSEVSIGTVGKGKVQISHSISMEQTYEDYYQDRAWDGATILNIGGKDFYVVHTGGIQNLFYLDGNELKRDETYPPYIYDAENGYALVSVSPRKYARYDANGFTDCSWVDMGTDLSEVFTEGVFLTEELDRILVGQQFSWIDSSEKVTDFQIESIQYIPEADIYYIVTACQTEDAFGEYENQEYNREIMIEVHIENGEPILSRPIWTGITGEDFIVG